jgi:hypothetical protein
MPWPITGSGGLGQKHEDFQNYDGYGQGENDQSGDIRDAVTIPRRAPARRRLEAQRARRRERREEPRQAQSPTPQRRPRTRSAGWPACQESDRAAKERAARYNATRAVGAIRGHAGMITREAPSAHVIRTDLPLVARFCLR